MNFFEKTYALALLLMPMVLFSSCSKVDYYKASDMDRFQHYKVKRTGDGAKWGVVAGYNDKTGNSSDEVTLIKCEYDTIYSLHKILDYMFCCEKDGKKYAIDCHGSKLWESGEFTSIRQIEEGEPYYSRSKVARFETPEGAYYAYLFNYWVDYFKNGGGDVHPEYFVVGPCDEFFEVVDGYLYKTNGKWGVVGTETAFSVYGNKTMKFKEILPAEYTAVYQVRDGEVGDFWMVNDGEKWMGFDNEGKPKNLHPSYYDIMLRIKKVDWDDYRHHSSWSNRSIRYGTDDAGIIEVEYYYGSISL